MRRSREARCDRQHWRAAEYQVERPYLRATWLRGVVLFLEGYDIAGAGYVVPSLVDVWRVDPSVFTEALAAGNVALLLGINRRGIDRRSGWA